VSPSASREVAMSGDLGLACPSPLLVLISLVGPQMEGGGIATRSGAGHNGHGETGEYAVRRWRKSTIGWCLSACV
jgi:hypothetical protein